MKKLFISFILILVATIAGQAQNTVYCPDNNQSYTTLTTAVASSGVLSGYTLELLDNQTCNNISISKNLIIKKSSSVLGELTLNYTGTARHFTIGTNTTVVFKHLTFAGPNPTGSTTATGGGIVATLANSVLTLDTCIINGCRGANGGALSFSNATQTVNMNQVSITNCSALSGNGGGVNCLGTLIVKNSTLDNNVTLGSGGGIYCSGALAIDHSIVQNNTASGSGGGIYITGPITLENVDILNNKAGWSGTAYAGSNIHGGGLYSSGDLTFKGNIKIDNNGARTSGGGIYNAAGALFDVTGVSSFSVTGNTTNVGSGGGIYLVAVTGGTTMDFPELATVSINKNIAKVTGGGIHAAGIISLNNASILENIAESFGGGIYIGGASSVNKLNVSGNNAGSSGGGICASANLTLQAVKISNNKAGYIDPGYVGTNHGGGLFISTNVTATFIGKIDLEDNTASGGGGAIYKNNATGAFDVSAVDTLIVTGNTARNGNGGGIYTPTALDLSNLKKGNISNNTTNLSGGGVYVTLALLLKNTTISGNKAGYKDTDYISGNNNGGGIYAANALTLIGDMIVKDNTAGNSGGGIFKVSTGDFKVDALLSFSVEGNTARGLSTLAPIGLGGGIYTAVTSTSTVLDFSKISAKINNNTAFVSGGGIYSTTTLNLNNATISNNAAYASGGGIWISTSGLTITNSIVSGNTAGTHGGGIFSATNTNIGFINGTNLTISGNNAGWDFTTNNYSATAYSGGGIYASGKLSLGENIIVENNTATGDGGAIYKLSANSTPFDVVQVKALTVANNTSKYGNGGAIYSPVELSFVNLTSKAIISNNKAESGAGGAVYALTDFSILESLMSGNSAAQEGGALNVKGLLNLTGATFSGNSATLSGGAIYKGNTTGGMSIVKSTFNDNTAGTIGGAIHSISSNASQEIGNCTFFQNGSSVNGGAIYLAAGTVSVYLCTFNANQAASNTSNAIYWGGSTLKLSGNIIYGNGSGSNSEVTNAGAVTAMYNIVREQTLSGTANQSVASASGSDVFSLVDIGNPDLAVLANNGGPTQTIMIKEDGLAHAKIPLSTSLGFGSSASLDQRGENRTAANNTDIGSVQIPPVACQRQDLSPMVWYVDLNTLTPGDGSDIATPAKDLHTVLTNSCLLSGDTIKVATGTYYATNTDPSSSFLINEAVVMLGGYTSNFTETERNVVSNLTVLDGKSTSYNVIYFTIGSSEHGVIDGFTIQNGKALGTGVQTYGGGIYMNAGSLTLSRSIINNNISSERGGGIYVSSNAALILSNSKVTGNKSGYNGTAFTAFAGSASPNASQLLQYAGGGICAEGYLELKGNLYFEANESAGNGGAILKGVQNSFITNSLDSITVTGCKSYVIDSNGSWGGGAIYTMVDLNMSGIKKGRFINCIANAGQGGGIFVNNKTVGRVTLSMVNGEFEGCRAQGANSDGGAIESYGSTASLVILKNSSFNNCYCGRFGGALGIGNVLKLEGKIEMNNCTADVNGGGITHWAANKGFPEYNEFDVTQLDSLIITNCRITKISASNSGGGGIWIQLSDLDLSPVKYVLFENNASATNGGALKFETATTLTLGNAIFRGNKASTTNGAGAVYTSTYHGGGVYTLGAITIKPKSKILLDGNISGGNGGGIWCGSVFTANQTDSLSIMNNEAGKGTAGNGGGIYASSTCTMDHANIVANKAKTNGGGIFANGLLTVDGSVFAQNAATAGGGIYSNTTSTITVSNSTFSGNTATNTSTGGGAIYSSPVNDVVRIGLSTFVGNTSAANQANAIYFNNAVNKFLNGNIIYGNGNGSEINVASATATYNIVRDFTLTGTGNKNLPDGELYNIYTTGNLEDNGGRTQTYMIKRGGHAQNLIPKTAVDSWSGIYGVITTDQRDSSRVESFADAGAVELKTVPMTIGFRKIGTCVNTSIDFTSIFTSLTQNVRDTLYYSDSGHTQSLPSAITVTGPPFSQNLYMRLISWDNMVVDTIAPYYIFNTATTWAPKNGTTHDWNDVANWSQGIPGPCTYAIIPGGVASYPVLQPVAVDDLPLRCDTIEFKFGGEVARTDYLNYAAAKVGLTVKGNRWYMIAPPLQSMFPGDVYVNDPNPRYDTNTYKPGYGLYAYAQLFNQTNPQTGKNVEGSWTGLFSTPDVVLNSGSGFALWIDDGANMGIYNPITFTFPKHDKKYYYYSATGIPLNYTTLNRTNENRFIYETVMNPVTKDVTLSSKANASNKLAIVGNPFVAHLDFDKFYLQNSQFINDEYKVMLADGNYGTYKIGFSNTYSLNNLIAPMQSFIVESVAPFVNLTTNVSQMAVMAGQTLRASVSDPVDKSELLVVASMGDMQNKTMIAYNPEVENKFERQKDSRKLFGKDYDDILTVYTRSSDGYALDINSFGELNTVLPIGIKTNQEGYVTLSFEGLENFMEGYDILLIDTQTKKEVDLREVPEYTFNNTVIKNYMDGRLFLAFREAESTDNHSTGVNNTESGAAPIFVVSRDRTIQVISTGELLETVQIFDIQGHLVSSAPAVNDLSSVHNVQNDGIYIVKAKTKGHSFIQKITVPNNKN